MNVRGIVREVGKGAKSYKVIITENSKDRTFHVKEDVMFLLGKIIEAEYTESKYKQDGVEKTSKWLVFNSIKQVDGVTTPKPPESVSKAQGTPEKGYQNGFISERDKKLLDLRSKQWNTCLMTVYPILSKDGLGRETIVEIVNYYAEEGYKFTYKEMK